MSMSGIPGRVEWDGLRCHHPTLNGVQLKTYELFMSEIFLFEMSRP